MRHAREDGAFVTFISFGEPYAGTYAALAKRHAEAWSAYYAASRVEVPDAELMRMRLMAEYQMRCNVTDWTIPVGIFPSHWSGKSFAFDEMYGVQGLLSAGHFAEDFPLEDGVPKAKFGTLGLLRAPQIPDIHAIYVEKDELLPVAYGAKGIGEIAAIPTAPAIQGAYYALDGFFRTKLPMEKTWYRK